MPNICWRISILVALGLIIGCAVSQTTMTPAVVGTKTAEFEVVSRTALKITPGTQFDIVEGPNGMKSVIVFKPKDGKKGGHMGCGGCVGAETGNCEIVSDHPDNASCTGACTNSEGNSRPCGVVGPFIGPPISEPLIKR